jgi:hypothetical protein
VNDDDDDAKDELEFNLRYAQRLCERTARFYRRIQTFSTFISLVAGSSAVAALSAQRPAAAAWLLAAFALFGCINFAIRPAEKIAANEVDVHKYAVLIAKSDMVDTASLQQMLREAHLTDAPEIEPLRAVAYNDVAREIGEQEAEIKLTPMQKLMRALA